MPRRDDQAQVDVEASDVAADLPFWAERAADRSRQVQRSRNRAVSQAQAIVDAAERLVLAKGTAFTTQAVVKEADIALQTLYRHFTGKDELALAVFEQVVASAAHRFEAAAAHIADPVEKLRYYIQQPVLTLTHDARPATFLATERWRLQQLFPDEMAQARRPITDLIQRELTTAM